MVGVCSGSSDLTNTTPHRTHRNLQLQPTHLLRQQKLYSNTTIARSQIVILNDANLL